MMGNYHGKIMNIPVSASQIVGSVECYMRGHKEARHAAAEVALEADREVERLKAAELRTSALAAADAWTAAAALVGSGVPPEIATEMFRANARVLRGEDQ